MDESTPKPSEQPTAATPAPSASILPYAAPPGFNPRKRPWSIPEIIAWVVIVAAAAGMMLSNAFAKSGDGGSATASQMLLQCRYIVGINYAIHSLEGSGSARLFGPGDLKQLTTQVDRSAKTLDDRLRAAMVRGEIEGKESALTQVDSLGDVYPALKTDAQTLRDTYEEGRLPPGSIGGAFMEKYGWFAHLAASNGKPQSDPERAGVIDAALRTMAGLLAGALLAVTGGVVGLILLIVAIVFFLRGRLKPRFNATQGVGAVLLPSIRGSYAEAFALFMAVLAGFLALSFIASRAAMQLPFAVRIISLPLAFTAGAIWPIIRGQSWAQWRAAVGLHAGRGVMREILAGILGYLAGFPIFIAGVLVTLVLIGLSGANPTHPINEELNGGPWVLFGVFLLASVWAPVTEELMFRGILFAHLRERYGWWISASTVALIFAAIHPQGWAVIPALGSLALVLAGIREWRGSIIGCMAAHALHNTLTLVVVSFMLS